MHDRTGRDQRRAQGVGQRSSSPTCDRSCGCQGQHRNQPADGIEGAIETWRGQSIAGVDEERTTEQGAETGLIVGKPSLSEAVPGHGLVARDHRGAKVVFERGDEYLAKLQPACRPRQERTAALVRPGFYDDFDPALLYRGHAYVPLWAIMNLTTGQALWKAQKKTLWLYSPGVSLTGAGPPETVGAQWVTGEGMEN